MTTSTVSSLSGGGQSANSGALPGMSRSTAIPANISEAGLISPTSIAGQCFVYQQFSSKLQAFMIGYVNSIYSNYSVFK